MNNYTGESLIELEKDTSISEHIIKYILGEYEITDTASFVYNWQEASFWFSLGYEPNHTSSATINWRTLVHPDDANLLVAHPGQGDRVPFRAYDKTIRFIHQTGRTVWLNCKGIPVFENNDQAPKVIISFTDVTQFKNKEVELQKRINRYSNIVQGTDIGTWEWNVQTGETIFNERWASIIGYSLSELEPYTINTWVQFAHPDDVKISDNLLKKHFEGVIPIYECEARLRHKDGHWVWILDRGKVITWTPDGKPEWMTGSHQDITQRKLKEERIKNVNKRNKLFIEQAPTAIAMLDRNMNYMAASQQWLKDYGLEKYTIMEKTFFDIFRETGDKWQSVYDACIKGEVIKREGDACELVDGTVRWLTWEVRPWYTNPTEVGGMLIYTADISEIKKAEKALQEKQTFLETILDSIDVGIISCNKEGQLTLFNRATREWHGLPEKSILPSEFSTYYGLYNTDGVTLLKTEEIPLLRALKEGSIKNSEMIIAPNNGQRRHISINGSQIKGVDGQVSGAVIAMHDITDRKDAEELLRVSEESFKVAFKNAATGIALLNGKGKWLKVNQSLCDMLGYSAEELTSLNFNDLTHPEDLKTDLGLLKQLLSGKISHYQMEKRYLHSSGDIVWTILSVSLVKGKDGKPLYFISQVTNITPQKLARQKLQETLAKLEGVLDASTQVSIIGTDINGVITTFNKGAENLLGYTKESMILKCTPEVIHLKSEVEQRGTELTTALGREIKGFKVFTALAETQQFETREWTYQRQNGTQFPVLLTVTAVKEEGQIVGYLGIAADISELKKAEQEVTSLLSVTKDQNERLKNFAHIVSHNLRSHSGNFSMLLKLLVNNDPRFDKDKLIPMLVTASDNLRDTITHLNEVVTLNSTVSDNLIEINLKDAADTAIENIMAVAREANTEIYNDIDPEINVLGVPAYMDSILLNFLTNGIKYRSKDRPSFVRLTASVEDGFTKITIQDNGLGIDLKKKGAKLFGMYKTFHGNADARGIGLFITKNQVEAMNGRIEVESEVNKGTTFKIYLKNEEN